MRLIKIILVGALALVIEGCASGSLLAKDPRCPFSERGGCHSVKTINKMIDENRYTPDGNFLAQPEPIFRACIKCRKTMQVYIPKSAQMSTGHQKVIEIIEVGPLEK